MSCDVGEVTESWRMSRAHSYSHSRAHSPPFFRFSYITSSSLNSPEQSSFSNLSITSPTSQLILQPFRRFTYATAHSPSLPLLHLRHSLFSNPSFTSPTLPALHLIHLASRPCTEPVCHNFLNHLTMHNFDGALVSGNIAEICKCIFRTMIYLGNMFQQ